MAIAFDAATFGHDNGGTGVLTFTHVCGASATVLLLYTQGSQTSDSIVSPTYNSVAFTAKQASIQGTASTRWIQLWYLWSPATGSHSVSIPSTSDYIQAFAASYTGTATSGTLTSHTASTASATTLPDSVTTPVDLCWVSMGTRLDSNGGPGNAGTGTTRRVADTDFDSFSVFDSNGVVTPAGSKTLTCNAGGVADPMADIIVAIPPPAAGGSRGLFRVPSVSGLGVGGSFFRDPLQGRALRG